MIFVADALVVAGVVLVGSLDGWKGAPFSLGLQYLGIALLLRTTLGIVPFLVAIVVAAGVIGVLATPSTGSWPSMGRNPRSWLSGAFRPGWFDLSVTAVAIVGALALASTRPVLGSSVDPAVDVLVFTGLLNCLVGRSPRIACGLLFLVSAGSVALQEIGQPPTRIDWFLLAVLQIALVLALTHLRSIEEQRAPERTATAAADGDGTP